MTELIFPPKLINEIRSKVVEKFNIIDCRRSPSHFTLDLSFGVDVDVYRSDKFNAFDRFRNMSFAYNVKRPVGKRYYEMICSGSEHCEDTTVSDYIVELLTKHELRYSK